MLDNVKNRVDLYSAELWKVNDMDDFEMQLH